jgi:hypothetical protein
MDFPTLSILGVKPYFELIRDLYWCARALGTIEGNR